VNSVRPAPEIAPMFAHSLVLNPVGGADDVYDHVRACDVNCHCDQRHHHEGHELAARVGGVRRF